MKRFFMTLIAIVAISTTLCAQRLSSVVAEARYITDKMALELGLSNVQRQNILQLNLTYLDGINSYRDIDANGWKHRNKEMKAMLSKTQWKKYKEAYYFYRPIGWRNNAYVHNIYSKYPKQGRDFNPRSPRSPRQEFGSRRGEKRNNSKEAIRMRKEMRKGVKFGAR